MPKCLARSRAEVEAALSAMAEQDEDLTGAGGLLFELLLDLRDSLQRIEDMLVKFTHKEGDSS